MGTVWHAEDRVTGVAVALKVLAASEHADPERFLREARVLAELRHPAIVSYVAHGIAADGRVYLAMEWLEGEDLACRLTRGALTLSDTFAVGRRAAAALGAAHDRRVIHRDVKPSNLFLPSADVSLTRLLDFGIARRLERTRALTRTGGVIGTVGYMAPEQAGGMSDIDARADVFALGCVLYECLVGAPAFSGSTPVAVLARLLLEDAPRVREARPDVPAAFDDLVRRMLSRDREHRPRTASEVLTSLDAFELERTGRSHRSDWSDALAPTEANSRSVASLAGAASRVAEQRLVAVLLVEVDATDLAAGATVERGDGDAASTTVDAIASRFGATVAFRAAGVVLVTMAGAGSATDRAARAASCGIALGESFPRGRVALAIGRASTELGRPVGPAVDRASALLDAWERGEEQASSRADAAASRCNVRIDDASMGLLDAKFELRPVTTGDHPGGIAAHEVSRERSEREGARRLLGKPTPFVGREKEQALLQLTLAESEGEPAARAVVVTGPPGVGKSRLRQWFAETVAGTDDVTVLSARADAIGAGSALVVARRLVESAAGIHDDASAAARVEMLTAHLATVIAAADRARVGEFLGAVLGLPHADQPSAPFLAARNDPRLMGEWMRRVFVEWLSAMCALRTTVLLVDDLHWADAASVDYLAAALRRLVDRPLFVLGFARPDVRDALPELWRGDGVQEIRLGGLPRRAAERLARAVLHDASDATISRVVERADGNTFLLEELIRAVAEGRDDGSMLPESVIAVALARIESLEHEARIVLRAASVIGESFAVAAVESLVRSSHPTLNVQEWLRAMAQREVLESSSPDAAADAISEYSFRHALLRDGAYATLSDDARRRLHAIAAVWVGESANPDPLVVAEHWDRSGDRERALPWLAEAVWRATNARDYDAAMTLANRIESYGATGTILGRAHWARALAGYFRGDVRDAVVHALRALDELRPGALEWLGAVSVGMAAAANSGDADAIRMLVMHVATLPPPPDASGPYGMAMAMLVAGAVQAGQRAIATEWRDRVESVAAGRTDLDPIFEGSRRMIRFWLGGTEESQLGRALESTREEVRWAEVAGDPMLRAYGLFHEGWCLWQLGAYASAIRSLEACRAQAADANVLRLLDVARVGIGGVQLDAGNFDAAVTDARGGFDALDPLIASLARVIVARAEWKLGRRDEAWNDLRATLEGPRMWNTLIHGNAALAEMALERGDAVAAATYARDAIAAEEEFMLQPVAGSRARIVAVRAAVASGDLVGARVALRSAIERIERIEATIADQSVRTSWRADVPANVETSVLAIQMLGERAH